MIKSKEELKSILIMVKEKSEKAGLKLNIQKTKITASSPITLWQTGESAHRDRHGIFLGSKIPADGDCRHGTEDTLFFGRNTMTTLDSILESRESIQSKLRFFQQPLHRCERWTIKKAECWRMGALELWCWRSLLRVPWKARRSNQSILREKNHE